MKSTNNISGIDRPALIMTSGFDAVISAAVKAVFLLPVTDLARAYVNAVRRPPASQKKSLDENLLTPNIL
jgi:hypothetical protein